MLNSMRDAARSPLALIPIGLLIVSLAVWGLSDVFLGGSGSAVAKAGDRTVALRDFNRAWEQEVRSLRQRTGGQFGEAEAVAAGLHRQTLNRLITETLLDDKADRLNLGMTEDAVFDVIRSQEAFQDLGGVFSPVMYSQQVQRAGYRSVVEFETLVRQDLRRSQLATAVFGGLVAPATLAAPRAAYGAEERDFSIVVIPADAPVNVGAPSDSDLADYYERNQNRYREPERRALSFFILEVGAFAAAVNVPEEDIRAFFETERERLTTPERRSVTEFVADTEELAAQAAARLANGEPAGTIGLALGLNAARVYDDAPRGDFFDTAVREAAFSTAEGAVSAPVQTALGGWAVVRVESVTPAQEPSYEDERPRLQAQLAEDMAAGAVFDGLEAYEAAFAAGASLEEGAEAANVPLFSYWPVDERGFDAQRERADLLGDRPEILQLAFTLNEGSTSDIRELGEDGFFVVRVDRIEEERTPSLEEVRERVVADWTQSQNADGLRAMAEAAQAALNAGQTAEAAAAAASPSARADAVSVTRAQAQSTEGGRTLVAGFSAELGQAVMGPSADGGLAVVRVEAIRPGEAALEGSEALFLTQALRQELSDDVSRLVVAGLQDQAGVEIFEASLASAVEVQPAP